MIGLTPAQWPSRPLPGQIWFILGGFAFLKLLILGLYRPFKASDTDGYRYVADVMSHDSSFWFSVTDWRTAALPGAVFRPIGYPLLLALFHNDQLVIACQIAASVIVAAILCRLVLDATGSGRVGALAGAFYLGGYSMLVDNTLLSDGLYAALFNIVILTLLGSAYRNRPITAGQASALGIAWGCSILVRESGAFLTLIPLALLVDRRLSADDLGTVLLARLRPLAAFLAPVLVVVGLYVGWNDYRTGEAFLGITGAANYLRPVFDIAKVGAADPFDDNSILSMTVKRTMKNFSFPEQFDLFQTMQNETGLTPVGLEKLFRGKFAETVVHHPIAYAEIVAKNLDPANYADLLFSPIFTLNDLFQLAVPPYQRIIPGFGIKSWKSLLADRNWTGMGLAFASAVSTACATALFLIVLVGLPLQAARQRWTPELSLGLKALGVFVTVVIAFALVHTEARLVVPAIPSFLIATAIAIIYRPLPIVSRLSFRPETAPRSIQVRQLDE
ncbi:MAG TPA: hypothetical protein VM689_13690 [Aliidongia sp.]|nr:hypothetical protein [Aliidongia sp.]